ncbi:hypothetical protein Agsp01_36570 [Agromyces sp. NBRC 114283]|nr:hypothetical protein Agsp01_36570 [Agromyces sp. NBRC 114283]
MRTAARPPLRVLHRRCSRTAARPPRPRQAAPDPGVPVLDVVAILGILAVFAVVALIAKGVEKL